MRILVDSFVLTDFDAKNAVEAGCDAVIVSNHGGRQLDGVNSTVSLLLSHTKCQLDTETNTKITIAEDNIESNLGMILHTQSIIVSFSIYRYPGNIQFIFVDYGITRSCESSCWKS